MEKILEECKEFCEVILRLGDMQTDGICKGITPIEYAATIAPMCRSLLEKIELYDNSLYINREELLNALRRQAC